MAENYFVHCILMLLEVCSCSIDIHIFDEILDLLWIGLTWYGYFTRIEAIFGKSIQILR
jgi:hypothetical protein